MSAVNEAVVVACGRSAIGKAPRGSLRDTRPDDFAAQVLQGVLQRVPGVAPEAIEDVIVGCAFPEAEQGMNVAKNIVFRAGLPDAVPGQTINRFCSSGLQAVASAAYSIMAGQSEIIVAGGVESMSAIPMGGNVMAVNPSLMENYPQAYTSMGLTAENVAATYGVSREAQDEFSLASHQKAEAAQKSGVFNQQVIPVDASYTAVDEKGYPQSRTKAFNQDEGIRPGATLDAFKKLKPVFKAGGSVTAGNSSQMSDGAAFTVVMSKKKAQELGLEALATFRSFAVTGVDPALMGIGPVKAIPKALSIAGLSLEDIGLIELNEAFAAQAIACISELKLNEEIVNVNGGAIALGHPLGCTGAFLTTKLVYEMRNRNVKYGVVSMCIGGGMGAAAVFELP